MRRRTLWLTVSIVMINLYEARWLSQLAGQVVSMYFNPLSLSFYAHAHTHTFSAGAKTTLYPNQYVRRSATAAVYLEVVVCVMLW